MEIKVTKEIHTLLLAIRALNHEFRLKILHLLEKHKTLTVNQLTEKLDVTQPEASQHLGILRRADLVKTNRVGKHIFYRNNETSLKQLKHIAEYWEDNTTTETVSQFIKKFRTRAAI